MGRAPTCRDCGARLDFVRSRANGRWVPLAPGPSPEGRAVVLEGAYRPQERRCEVFPSAATATAYVIQFGGEQRHDHRDVCTGREG